MNVVDLIVIGVIAMIIGLAAGYVYKAKKSGKKCIGCPDAESCGGKCSGGCSGCSGNCGGKQ